MKRFFVKLVKTLGWLALAGMIALAAYTWVLRPWHLHWGATSEDVAASLPGDEYIAKPANEVRTRAITIQATPAEIWPWVVQLGADKGGMYSYSNIETMINCPQTNADRIHPEWQNLQEGDQIKMCPDAFGPPPFIVVEMQTEQALVLGQPPLTAEDEALGLPWMSTWTFILQPVDETSTRLIVRSRDGINPGWMKVIEPGVFIMESQMLRGIKERAEG